MSYDLHCHSYFSDGEWAPERVVASAHQAGVTTLALTDHDTVSGLSEASTAAAALGMTLINGIELSADWNGTTLHLLGLRIDPTHPTIKEVERVQCEARLQRAKQIIEKLEALKITGVFEHIKTMTPYHAYGRLHIARALVALGRCKSLQAAFSQYLGRGKTAYVPTTWMSLAELTECIHAAGGMAVIAHPKRYKLTTSRLSSLLTGFAKIGDGIEVVTSGQPLHETRYLAEAAATLGLLSSVGSDFHGPMSYGQFGRLAPLPTNSDPIWTRW